ncbi:LURP-one-related family protein [Irregularibacter muris]|uniref:LURP-one-related family protein n=1 Tax=Irregularibacter muris TaxID=1796619 RepID=A0AAE3HCL6_9FIRM|nr:LURP-one-related family protein [Irregularibacter muris]MCR1897546.1 LURP-one-related family protein [Irregularibacter muris]
MQYKIRQKIFSFGDNFTIKDNQDQDRYIVRGKVFAIGDKLKIEDLQGHELMYIEQKVFRFLPEYSIYSSGQHLATVKKELTFLKPRFNIKSIMGNFQISGDFFGHDFQILKNNHPVASVNKKWLSFSDTYMVEINDNEDQAFMLALVIVIDQVLHDNNQNNN